MDNTHFDPAAPLPRPSSELLHPPRSFGEFRLLRLLGEGGMGFVYLGYHEGQKRQVAIKVLADPLANSQSYIDRFYREAKSGALLNHPNIVSSLGAGQDRTTGKHYLVLEFVDGLSCRALLEQHTRLWWAMLFILPVISPALWNMRILGILCIATSNRIIFSLLGQASPSLPTWDWLSEPTR